MATLAQILLAALKGVLQGWNHELVQELWTEFAGILFNPLPLLTDPLVTRLQEVFMAVALGALPGVIGYQALRRIGEASLGASTVSASTIVRRAVTATITVTGISLFSYVASTLMKLAVDTITSLPSQVTVINMLFDLTSTEGKITASFFFMVFLGAIGCLIVQRFVFQAEFTILLVVGLWIGVHRATTDESHPWQVWKREFVAILLTTVLQVLTLWLFAERLGNLSEEMKQTFLQTLSRWFQSGALVYLLWNTPRWARQFTYSVGTAHSVAGVAVSAGRLAMVKYMMSAAAKGA
jgi:hypothetical protein